MITNKRKQTKVYSTIVLLRLLVSSNNCYFADKVGGKQRVSTPTGYNTSQPGFQIFFRSLSVGKHPRIIL